MDLLTSLGQANGTDKVSHGFCAFYHRHLAGVRLEVRKVLEIGILGGASIHMWQEYFPNAVVHGFDKQAYDVPLPDRVYLHRGDQASRESLQRLIDATGSDFDLIIEDGGHTMEQQQVSLGFLFPHVCPGGMYIVEDLHTSYMDEIYYAKDGQETARYSTGANECLCTTFDLIEALTRNEPTKSNFMSAMEIEYVMANVATAEIFDRDNDRNHLTSMIHKRVHLAK